METKYCTAIVLAAERGTRMGTKTQKQYLAVKGKPILYYSLKAFEETPSIDEIILVTGEQEIEYCKKNIVEKYQFSKIKKIIAGGKERYDSVWAGIQHAKADGYICVHDGARPFISRDIIEKGITEAKKYQACVIAVPVKDTIKIANSDGFVESTPERSAVWAIQTPQIFSYEIIYKAYENLMKQEERNVTDDAMVVEKMLNYPIRLVEGEYKNIKITTMEDLLVAEAFIQ